MAKSQGVWTCAFCGCPGERSKEHVLAQGLEEILPAVPATHDEYEVGIGLDAEGGAYSPMPCQERRTAPKKILDRVTRDVCSVCNSGWMGRLDQVAKPLIAQLLDAGRGGGSVRLNKEDARALTRWAVKTAWTNELSSAGDKQRELLLTTQAEREGLRQGDLPSRTRLWLAHYQGTEIEFAQGQGHRDRHTPPREGETPRPYLLTLINLGGLVFLLGTGAVDGYVPALDQEKHTMVWPHVLGAFPPVSATGQELNSAITSLGHWIQSHPRPYNPSGEAVLIGPRSVRADKKASKARRAKT